MSSVADVFDKMLGSASFQIELKRIQEWATNELYESVLDTIYSQPESKWYERTYSLLTAIMPTELKVTPNSIEFKVIFNDDDLHHTSLFGSDKYGLDPGDPIGSLIVPFLNEGWRWDGYEGEPDRFMARNPEKFLEKAIERIQAQVVTKVRGALSAEVRKIGGKYN